LGAQRQNADNQIRLFLEKFGVGRSNHLHPPQGNRPRLCLRIFNGSIDSKKFIRFLKDIKRRMKDKKLLLFIDGLPAHRAKIATNRKNTGCGLSGFPLTPRC
jgi:hypothetical protein